MNTSTENFRLGIIGCGAISHYHANAVSKSAYGLRLISCCDIREEVAKNFARQYGCCAWYADYTQMIREQALDGIVLATWPNQHREQIERCLEAGARNILCEKSLALTGQHAVEIQTLIGEAGAFLMEGYMYRHHPVIRKIEHMVVENEIGVVDNVRGVFSSFDPEMASASDATRNWRQRPECGGGVPHDFACYATNASNLFAPGRPKTVFATGGISEHYGTVNRMYGLIEYDSGCIGMIESSKKADFSQELQITGASGIINLPIAWTVESDTVIEVRHSRGWADVLVEQYTVKNADSYQLQTENFADVVRGRAEPIVPLIDSVVNCFTIEALLKSLEGGCRIEIDLPESVKVRRENRT